MPEGDNPEEPSMKTAATLRFSWAAQQSHGTVGLMEMSSHG